MAASEWPRSAQAALERLRARPVRRGWLIAALALLLVAIGAGLAVLPQLAQRSPNQAGGTTLKPPPPPIVEVPRVLDIPPETARVLNSKVPLVVVKPVAARAFAFAGDAESFARATDCLAAAAWYEAGDDATGERAVIQVVLNRARHPAFPRTVCGVVFQGSERTTGCQFTFTCDGALARLPSGPAWLRARALAAAALAGGVDPAVGYATHYHADYVVPYWRSSLDKIAQVDTHIFYRWPGYWGKPGAFADGTDATEPFIAKLARVSLAHLPTGQLPAEDSLIAAGTTAIEPIGGQPVPPAQLVAGVTQKALRKAIVRGSSGSGDRFYIQVDPDTFPGSYATAAVALCKGKPACRVLGWRDPSRMGTAMPLSEGEANALSFYYENKDGGDRALWNCGQIPRKNPAQCLPNAAAKLADLVN